MKFSFRVVTKDTKSNARVGILKTPHGVVQTPSFMPVGTKGTVKSLTPEELNDLGAQIILGNTYHLYLQPGHKVVSSFGGLHSFMNWQKPILTDSGGFQIFSLGVGKRKLAQGIHRGMGRPETSEGDEKSLCEIHEEGVTFTSHLDGTTHTFTPEKSIEIQQHLGADIMLMFDECTYFPATHEYAKAAMDRTHRWASRCINAWTKKEQSLFGIVQGGIYRDLREESSRFIANLDTPGVCIGGVSVGESKSEMRDVLEWSIPHLPEDKPRHLLGVGDIDDVFDAIERGIDLFDCVSPTRLGRMGHVFVRDPKKRFRTDITNSLYSKEKGPIMKGCDCYTCLHYSAGYVHHLFRAHELLAYRLASIHNLRFLVRLVDKIREAITQKSFQHLKKEWLNT